MKPVIDIIDAVKIQEIYSFKLMSVVDICKYLDIWNKISEEEREFYLSLIDIKKYESFEDLSFWQDYSNDFVYGEITKKGVIRLSEYISKLSGNFYDIGSGNGKLLLHLSLISNFDKYVGVEICEPRHLYALEIKKNIQPVNVEFICEDVSKIDLSEANVLFINDLMFSKELLDNIVEKIPVGSHYISAYKNETNFIEDIYLDVTWFNIIKHNFYLHKKK